MADAQRVEIGFGGGQVVSVRVTETELRDLRAKVEAGGWHDVHTDDGVVAVGLDQVVFLRIVAGDQKVGF